MHAHAHAFEVRKLAEVASKTSGQLRIALETALGPICMRSPLPPSYGAVEKKGMETETTGFGRAGPP